MGLKKWFYTCAMFLLVSGCVSAKKFDELEENHTKASRELQEARDTISEMTVVITDLQNKLGTTTLDKTNLQSSMDDMKAALKEMEERRQLAELRTSEYAELLQKFQKLIDTGKLRVQIIDGRMVVSLGSDILFASGSGQLSSEGQSNIREIGGVLRTLGDRKYQIEGHTDNVPIKTQRFPSNWELASERAVTVLKTLIASGMKPKNISAASFADTKPVGNNSTAEGRQMNRRIEIVVVPDLSDLPGFDELNKMAGGGGKAAASSGSAGAPPKIKVEGL